MLITLTTIGRRSGRPRAVRLYAFEDGENLVVTGSRGGADQDPAWVHNLRSGRLARVTHGRRDLEVTAHEAEGAERARLWGLVCEGFPMYERYQRRTVRPFPLFVLEPVDDPDVR